MPTNEERYYDWYDNWGYKTGIPRKRVYLNIQNLKNAFSKKVEENIESKMYGTGKAEFAWDIANRLFSAIKKGIEGNEKEVDVTILFSMEYFRKLSEKDEDNIVFSQANVKSFLLKRIFDIVEETDEQLIVALKEELI